MPMTSTASSPATRSMSASSRARYGFRGITASTAGGDELVAVNAIPPGIGHRGAKRDIAILYGARRFAACRRNDRHQASFRSKNHIPLGMLTVGKRPLLGLHILENA